MREYVSLYEHAPQMKADGVSDYRQLAAFGDTVLATTYNEKNGFMFCTWKQNTDGNAVFWGDYSPNYEYAKEAFAVRSGLVSKSRLFSENESADIYRCVDFAKANCETLTYEQERQLDKLQEKLTDGYPSLETKLRMSPPLNSMYPRSYFPRNSAACKTVSLTSMKSTASENRWTASSAMRNISFTKR